MGYESPRVAKLRKPFSWEEHLLEDPKRLLKQQQAMAHHNKDFINKIGKKKDASN